jgi:hypothetical protein
MVLLVALVGVGIILTLAPLALAVGPLMIAMTLDSSERAD